MQEKQPKDSSALQDASTQLKTPSSSGSRGLDYLARHILKNHPMRKWIDLVDEKNQNKHIK
jgi:hypothetical protein